MEERSSIRSGLWGGPLGEVKAPSTEATAVSTILKKIVVNYNEHAICTIEVIYENAKGCLGTYGPWGGTPRVGTWKKEEICFQTGEILTFIEGTHDTAQGVYCITSLAFKTNKHTKKTIGYVRGTEFSFQTPNGQIVGFYGRFGAYTDAIGIYLAPDTRRNDVLTNANIIKSGLWGGPGGDMRAPDDGTITRSNVLKQITINYNQLAIRTLQFYYEDAKGCLYSNGPWGCNPIEEKWVEEKICFQTGEILTIIDGTYDIAEGFLVVTSLSFKTNKNTHKTIGHVTGTKFSFGTTDGKIVSFYGRFGGYIDAIGIYLAPN